MQTYDEIKSKLLSICKEFSEYPEQLQAKVVEILGNHLTRAGGSTPTEARDQKPRRIRLDKNPPKPMPPEFLLGSPSSGVKSFRDFCESRARPKPKHEYLRFAVAVFYCEKKLGYTVTLSHVLTCWTHMEWPTGDFGSFRQKITNCNNQYDLFLVFDETGTDDIRMSPAGINYVDSLPSGKPRLRRIR